MKYAVYKIIAISIHPVTAQDEMLVCKFLYIILPCSLGTSVNGLRICVIELCIWGMPDSVKYIICGYLYHLGPYLSCHNT